MVAVNPNMRPRLRVICGVATTAACVAAAVALPRHALYWRSTTADRHNEWLTYYVEDYAATVAVVTSRSIDGEVKCLEVDGIPVAGSEFMLRTTQKTQAHIPLLIFESQNHGCRPNKVLAVGLGSGGTSWSAARHSGVPVTCIELVPGVEQAARREFTEENHGIFDSAGYSLHIGDGRNYLLMSRDTFDVILTESVHPIYAGNASLYSRDYFTLCRDHLSKHGVFSVWLPIYRIAPEDFKTVLQTFESIFPHTTVWFTSTCASRQVLLIGTVEKTAIDVPTWVAMAGSPGVHNDLKEVNLGDPYKLLDCMIMAEKQVKDFASGAALHTDSRPVLEFSAPRSRNDSTTWRTNLSAIIGFKDSLYDCLAPYPDSMHYRLVLARYAAADRHILAGIVNHFADRANAIREYRIASGINPSDPSVKYLVDEAHGALRAEAGHFEAEGKTEEACALYRKFLAVNPEDFDVARDAALWLGSLHRVDSAIAVLNRLAPAEKNSGQWFSCLGTVYINNSRWNNALAAFDSAVALNPRLSEAYTGRSVAYAGKGRWGDALADLDTAISINPLTPNAKENRAYVYRHMGSGRSNPSD